MDMREVNKSVVSEFRASGGKLSGPMEGAPILLLTTTGRRTGRQHTTPLGFIDVDGRLAVAAANGGSDRHADWYYNIETDQQVTVELPGASVSCNATVASGVERTDLLAELSQRLPGMAGHIAATTREVPVVILNEVS